MSLQNELYEAAVALARERYPNGWGGAASVRTETGKILTSVAPDTKNDALALCMEVGAILEAHKLGEVATHSLCVSRENENAEFVILTPCGICQERLIHWGGDVQIAITNPANELLFKALRDLQPHHWSGAFGEKI